MSVGLGLGNFDAGQKRVILTESYQELFLSAKLRLSLPPVFAGLPILVVCRESCAAYDECHLPPAIGHLALLTAASFAIL